MKAGRLEVDIVANSAQFTDAMEDAAESLDNLDKKTQDSNKFLDAMGRKFFSAEAAIRICEVAIRAIADGFKKSLELANKYSDDFRKQSTKLGQTFEVLQNVFGKNVGDALAPIVEKLNTLARSKEGIQGLAVGITILTNVFRLLAEVVSTSFDQMQNFFKYIEDISFLFKIIFSEEADAMTKLKAIAMLPMAGVVLAAKNLKSQAESLERTKKAFAEFGADVEKNKKTIASLFAGIDGKGGGSVKALGDQLNQVSGIIGGPVSKAFTKLGEVGSSALKGLSAGFKTSVLGNYKDLLSGVSQLSQQIVQQATSSIQSILSNVTATIENLNQKRSNILQAQHDKEIEMIDARLARELELIENDGKTKEEKQNEDLAALYVQLNKTTNLKKKAAIQEQIDTIEKEKKIAAAKKQADREKAQSDYKVALAKYEMDKKQFELNQMMAYINLTIQYALGLVNAWVSAFQIGNPIAAAVFGGVFTGLITAAYAAGMALTAQQQFTGVAPTPPAFATGGIVPGASYTGDQVAIRANSGEMMLNMRQQMNLFDMVSKGFGGGQPINIILDGQIVRSYMVNNQMRESYVGG